MEAADCSEESCEESPSHEFAPDFHIAALLEAAGFGRYQHHLFVVCGIGEKLWRFSCTGFNLTRAGWAADIANLVAASFLPGAIETEWPDTSNTEASLPASASFLGMLFGSVFWGALADRCGRRPAFLWTCAVAGGFGFASALSPSLIWLALGRLLTGFGLGGNLAIDFSLFMEYVPMQQRGRILIMNVTITLT